MTLWNPPMELSAGEKFIAKRCEKRRVFVFLRELRHVIFDTEVQEKLNAAYSSNARGKERVCPAQLALAGLLQAALRVPDHEVVELTVMDKRWQMVLDCVGEEVVMSKTRAMHASSTGARTLHLTARERGLPDTATRTS
ncbi:MAG TPA: hypothetical protein VIV60_15140, partial [Polyangiaceae bacterium]